MTDQRNSGRVLYAATSAMAMLVLDSSIVGVMLPSMRNDLGLSATEQNWTVSAYLLTLAVLLPIGGRVVDAVGPVRGFIAGMCGFAAASLIIGVSQGPYEMIAARGFAGVAAAVLMPATIALIFAAFPPDGRARAMAIYTGSGQALATVGPAVGGLCAEFLSWRVGFLINVPVGVLGIGLLATARMRRAPITRPSWDPFGLLTLTVGLGGLSFGLVQMPAWGVGSPIIWATLVVGGVSVAMFVRHCLRRSEPLLDLHVFSDRIFAAAVTVLACLGFAMTVLTIYPAISLQSTLSLSPAAAGVALLPLVVPLLVATRWVGRHFDDVGPRRIALWGSVAVAVGAAIVGCGLAADSTIVLCVGLLPAGVGIGLLLSPMTTVAVGAVDESLRGQASGSSSMLRQLGGIVGLASFGIITSVASSSAAASAIGFALTAALMVVAAAVGARILPTPQAGAR
ncbi:MFS transporter [Gordonia sp. OPL2]|uniref:MFS transporter n=1 Tax=Gordonia sp. OPL2 TaxID=2486274 RepID=UPI001654DDA9|nr:MFS transporter [Gordonia sp. OPL2]ROZ85474.1 MFS transporter [Gordonia sp. OPL2]